MRLVAAFISEFWGAVYLYKMTCQYYRTTINKDYHTLDDCIIYFQSTNSLKVCFYSVPSLTNTHCVSSHINDLLSKERGLNSHPSQFFIILWSSKFT